MSGRFISAGTAEDPPDRDDDWLSAQRELDANALHKKEQAAAGSGIQADGKSLFEVLQANKAAKQDAFEEAAKLKNQFRSLDEDEIDFLDSVMESTRKRELEVNKETSEQLELFRQQREEAARIAREAEDPAEEVFEEGVSWKVGGRKRKKGRENDGVKGLKMRKLSSNAAEAKGEKDGSPLADGPPAAVGTISTTATTPKHESRKNPPPHEPTVSGKASTTGLGLVDYGSDDD